MEDTGIIPSLPISPSLFNSMLCFDENIEPSHATYCMEFSTNIEQHI